MGNACRYCLILFFAALTASAAPSMRVQDITALGSGSVVSNFTVGHTGIVAYFRVTEGAAAGKILGALDSAGNITYIDPASFAATNAIGNLAGTGTNTTLTGDWSLINSSFNTNTGQAYFENFVTFQNDVTFNGEQVTFAGSLIIPLDFSVAGTFAADGPSIFSGAVSSTPRNVTGSIVDASLGNVFFKTLGANIDLAVSNMVSGQTIMLMVTNPAAYTVGWPQFNATNFNDTVMPVATTNGTTFYWFTKIGTATNGFFLGKSYRMVYSTGLTAVTNAEAGTITLTSSGGGSGMATLNGVATNVTFVTNVTIQAMGDVPQDGTPVELLTIRSHTNHNNKVHTPYQIAVSQAANSAGDSNTVWGAGVNPFRIDSTKPGIYWVTENKFGDADTSRMEHMLKYDLPGVTTDMRLVMWEVFTNGNVSGPFFKSDEYYFRDKSGTHDLFKLWGSGANLGNHTMKGSLTMQGGATYDSGNAAINMNDNGYVQWYNATEAASTYMRVMGDNQTFQVGVFGMTNIYFGGFVATAANAPMVSGHRNRLLYKTAAYTVNGTNDNHTVFANNGTTSKVDFTLPTAVPGMTYTFIVQDGDGLRIIAPASTTIRSAADVTTTAGNMDSTTIGSTMTVIAISTTEYYATSTLGTWVAN